MLTAYLIALGFGGTLLVTSMLLGGDGDGDGIEDLDGIHSWFPIQSLRFWIYWLSFTGVTGALLTAAGSWPPLLVAVVAFAVGWTVGAGTSALVRRLQARAEDEALGDHDLRGATARVLLPVAPGRTGKVRLELRGRTVDRMAETDEQATLDRDAVVLVYDVKDDGHVRVARLEKE